MCHEATNVALADSFGLGTETVTLDDFELADAIFLLGQNFGTNHPHMLSILSAASKHGADMIAINPHFFVGRMSITQNRNGVLSVHMLQFAVSACPFRGHSNV